MKKFLHSTIGRIVSVCIMFATSAVFGIENPEYPFPQHVNYGKGTIFPNQYSHERMDDDIRAFYDYWKQEYIVQAGEDEKGHSLFRVALGHPESDRYGTTVSEGQAYGMIIVSVMAGYDKEAKNIFDGLWRFAKQHPSAIDSRLMAWRVSEDNPQEGDHDSAFDGDADIAYALLLADRQWGSNKENDYIDGAKKRIAAVYESTIGPRSKLPMLGDWVKADGAEYNQYTNRTSDFMLANFQAFSRFTHHKKWKQVIRSSRKTIEILQKRYSRLTGLLPDFIEPVSGIRFEQGPANPYFLEGENDGNYYYNACRVPFRVGMDALLNKNRISKKIVNKISKWAEQNHEGDPYHISAGYTLDGMPLPDSSYFSTAFVAPLGVAAMNSPTQQQWLNAIYDAVKQEHQDYYEDTLNLLSLLVMTGNFWDPAKLMIHGKIH